MSQHKTALARQIMEAVRIRRRGGAGAILNSRAEFDRCRIPRLVLEQEDGEKISKQEDKELEEASTRDGYEDRPTLIDVASNCTICAISNPAVTENKQKIEDNAFERRQPQDITVNGISLMSIMKNKSKESIKLENSFYKKK